MADSLSSEKRSWNMSRIKGKDTVIEVKVRKYLYHQGFRYRKNVSSLPGKPDIVLSKYKTVIFVHGCFWHRHTGCKDATVPKSRTEFWMRKFERNTENDAKHFEELTKLSWRVIVIWECEVNKKFDETMEALIKALKE